MTKDPSVCVAQICSVRGDVRANVVEHLHLVELAAGFGADVVVFAELSLTGYELDLGDQLAMSENDARLVPLLDAASSRGLTIIVGAPVRVAEHLHIGAFIIQPDRTVALYTKQHLGAFDDNARCDGNVPPPEATFFEPGALDPRVRFGNALAAVAICADTSRASHPDRAARSGAKAYLASMFVIPSEFESSSARLKRYAEKHHMLVALANFGSPTGGLAAAGRSSIWSEGGDLVAQLPSTGSGVAVATRTRDGWLGKVAMLHSRGEHAAAKIQGEERHV
jgi:predicted amidohydrolase